MPERPEDSWGDELAATLEVLRQQVEACDEPALWSLLTAANEIADAWLDSCDRIAAAQAEVAAAEAAERAVQERLRSVVLLIQTFPQEFESRGDLESEVGDALPSSEEKFVSMRRIQRGTTLDRTSGIPSPHGASVPETAPLSDPEHQGPPGNPRARAAGDPASQEEHQEADASASADLAGASGEVRGPSEQESQDGAVAEVQSTSLRVSEDGPRRPRRRDEACADTSLGSSPAQPHSREVGSAEDIPDALAAALDRSPMTPSVLPPQPPDEGVGIYLFGRLRVHVNGAPIDLGFHGKALCVFRYLLAHRSDAVPKDVLIDLFWADSGVDNGRRGLHQAIYTVRKALKSERPEDQLIVFEDGSYRVNPALTTWSDVDEFEALVDVGQRAVERGQVERACAVLQQAEQLKTGDFAECAPYEDWAISERERLRLLYIEATNLLADMLEAIGDMMRAVDMSHRVLSLEPCDEGSHRRIMRCHVASGNRTLAVRQYRVCAERLQQEYGLDPSSQTVELHESLIHSRQADDAP